MKKPIMMVAEVKMPGIGGGFWILSVFKDLSFCGPCRPSFRVFSLVAGGEDIIIQGKYNEYIICLNSCKVQVLIYTLLDLVVCYWHSIIIANKKKIKTISSLACLTVTSTLWSTLNNTIICCLIVIMIKLKYYVDKTTAKR